uniref:Uncharacterized protein n=1 Tax=Oryza nivara TaxID=4536 RepID=A0A0E0FYF8_ORYNI
MVDDPHLPPRLRQARRSHSHCVEERSRLVLERVHLVDACRVHARRSEVECRNTVPLRAEHGDHLVPAPCSMAKAMDRDEMLATATAAAFHFLGLVWCWVHIFIVLFSLIFLMGDFFTNSGLNEHTIYLVMQAPVD